MQIKLIKDDFWSPIMLSLDLLRVMKLHSLVPLDEPFGIADKRSRCSTRRGSWQKFSRSTSSMLRDNGDHVCSGHHLIFSR